MEALKLQSTASVLAARLREAIADGILRPGDPIRQEDISARLGVSRSPLREALRQLEAEGLIDYRPNRGASVARLTAEDVAEIYEIRRMLQLAALELALPRADAATLKELRAIFARLDTEKDERVWIRLHWQFHETLYSVSKRKRLVQLIHAHHIRFDAFPKPAERFATIARFSRRDLRGLLQAIARKDLRAARSFTLLHLQNLEKMFLNALRGATACQTVG